jgi:hypothetical protein
VLMVAAFAASSPFVFANAGEAWEDFSRVQRLARDGWLGFEHDHATPIAFVDRLWEGLGPVLVIAAAGLVVALVRRGRADLVLASFVIVYFADLLTIRAHFDRYTLPLIPPLAALASRFRALTPVTLLLLVVPLTWSVRHTKELTRTDTRVIAARWVAHHVAPGTEIAADPSTPAFAGLEVQSLQLPGPGRRFDPNRDVATLRREGIHVVVVTGAVADRILAARERYPREAAFYDDLAARGKRLYYVAKGDGRAGPWVAIYRL